MSHQIITRMAYNAKTKQIETWQHSNNVWPRTDYYYALDVRTDEQMFGFITLVAEGAWQGRKWEKAFKTLFCEYPELVMDSYKHELNKSYEENCAIRRKYKELARSKRDEISSPLYILPNPCFTCCSSSVKIGRYFTASKPSIRFMSS